MIRSRGARRLVWEREIGEKAIFAPDGGLGAEIRLRRRADEIIKVENGCNYIVYANIVYFY